MPQTQTIVLPLDVLLDLGIETPSDRESALIDRALISATGAVRSFLHYDPILGEHTEFHPQQPFQAQIQRGIWEVMEQRATIRQVSEAATNEMQLQHLPVRGDPLITVKVDYDGRSESRTGSFPASSNKTIGQDFWPNYDVFDVNGVKVCRDGVIRTIGLWPTTPGCIKVVYTAGYSADEFNGQGGVLDASPIYETIRNEAVRRVRRVLVMGKGRFGVPAGIMSSETLGGYSYSMDTKYLDRLFSGDLMPDSAERLNAFVNWGTSIGS